MAGKLLTSLFWDKRVLFFFPPALGRHDALSATHLVRHIKGPPGTVATDKKVPLLTCVESHDITCLTRGSIYAATQSMTAMPLRLAV